MVPRAPFNSIKFQSPVVKVSKSIGFWNIKSLDSSRFSDSNTLRFEDSSVLWFSDLDLLGFHCSRILRVRSSETYSTEHLGGWRAGCS